MSTSLLFRVTAAASLAALTADAVCQGQPVTRVSRSSGLAVRELVTGAATASGGVPLITVTSDPGSVYFLFSQVELPTAMPIGLEGAQSMLPPALGPLGLTSPAQMAAGLFVDPAGGVVGTIPAGGVQNLNLAAPLIPGTDFWALEIQALVFRPNGIIEFSNSQIRQVQPAAAVMPIGFTPSAPMPTSDGATWDDIEQGDVDGDGDLDLIGITQDDFNAGGSVLLWLAAGGTYAAAPIVIQGTGDATSGELADFNGDGFLDLAVAFQNTQFHLQVFLNNGLGAGNAWLGFTQLPNTQIIRLGGPFNTHPADLETADVDGDGDLDILLACALNPVIGEQNRLFLNTLGPAGLGFTDVTPTNLLPAILDDTEDCEFLDFDLDGDLDIVFANFDGTNSPFGEGVDYVMVNQGGAQGGPMGVFLAPPPGGNPIPPLDDESSDVVVGDFDGDGDPDLYVTNWRFSTVAGGTVTFGAPRADRLLVNNGAGAFVDMSALLPPGDGPGTDAEVADFDLDGTLDVAVGLGSLRTGVMGPQGVFVLQNPAALAGPLVRFDALIGAGAPDVRDLEIGDWARFLVPIFQARWFDKDLGVATLGTPPGAPGLFPLERN